MIARNRIRRMRRAAVIVRDLYRATDPLVADLGMLAEIARQSGAMALAIDEGRVPDIAPAEMLAVARKACTVRIACVLPTDADDDRTARLVLAALDRTSREVGAKLAATVARIDEATVALGAAVEEARQVRPALPVQLLAAVTAAGINAEALDGVPLGRVSAASAADETADLAEEHRLASLAIATLDASTLGGMPCAQ